MCIRDRDAGLLKNKDDKALSSAQLNEMSDDEVKKIIPHIRVIARALPTDKSRMVRLCQEMNLVVGMTGDGVNDSPALKRADVDVYKRQMSLPLRECGLKPEIYGTIERKSGHSLCGSVD